MCHYEPREALDWPDKRGIPDLLLKLYTWNCRRSWGSSCVSVKKSTYVQVSGATCSAFPGLAPILSWKACKRVGNEYFGESIWALHGRYGVYGAYTSTGGRSPVFCDYGVLRGIEPGCSSETAQVMSEAFIFGNITLGRQFLYHAPAGASRDDDAPCFLNTLHMKRMCSDRRCIFHNLNRSVTSQRTFLYCRTDCVVPQSNHTLGCHFMLSGETCRPSCAPGFTKNVSLIACNDSMLSPPSFACEPAPCPPNSAWDGRGGCQCLPGFAGQVNWTGSTHVGLCTPCSSPDTYADEQGLADCKRCAAGYFAAPAGAGHHTGCRADLCGPPPDVPPFAIVDEQHCPSSGTQATGTQPASLCYLACRMHYVEQHGTAVPHVCQPNSSTSAAYHGGGIVCFPAPCDPTYCLRGVAVGNQAVGCG